MPLLATKLDPATAFLRQLHWPPSHRLTPSIIRGGFTGLVVVGLVIALRVFAGDNLHAVQPLRTYRAGQMKPDRLQQVIHHFGIRTVVNLRGYCGDFDWYSDECRATHDANVAQEDITLSAVACQPRRNPPAAGRCSMVLSIDPAPAVRAWIAPGSPR